MNYTIKIKGGQENDIPQLKPRELGYCTDTGKAFIGTETGNKDFFKVIIDKIGDGFTSENTITSQLNAKVNKTSIINNCNTTEEGFVLDARQGKTLYDMLNRIIIKKIYPTFTNGVATINLTGATDTTPVIISNNHSSINSVSVAGVIPSTDTVKIRLSDTSINGTIGMTLIAKL